MRLNFLSQKGILMCDDVWRKTKSNDPVYMSLAAFETLCSFSNANIIETTFVRKKIGKKYSSNYKYVSFSKKLDGLNSEIKNIHQSFFIPTKSTSSIFQNN